MPSAARARFYYHGFGIHHMSHGWNWHKHWKQWDTEFWQKVWKGKHSKVSSSIGAHFNHWWLVHSPCNIGHMLSVGGIGFEDMFCTSKKHCKLGNEWACIWQRPWTPRGLMEEPLAQVSSASWQQKWNYASYKVSIGSESLLENETITISLVPRLSVATHQQPGYEAS